MNKKMLKSRTLKLNRETLRVLDSPEMAGIIGGASVLCTNGPACVPTRECIPETQSCQYTACAGGGGTCTAV